MRNLLTTSILATALTVGSVAPVSAELRLGALSPTTGDLQLYGNFTLNGIRLAVEEINAAGGVLGAPIRLIVGDTQTNPQAGVDAAQRLVSIEGVHAMIGALASGVTIPVARSVSRVAGVAQISNASTSPVISTLDDNDFLFRTVPSDAYQGVALAQIAMDEGYRRLAVLHENNDYGLGLAQSFVAAYRERGGVVPQIVTFEPNVAAYRGELLRASSGNPEALVLIAYPENGQTIIRQAIEGGFFEKFVFTDGLRSQDLVNNIGARFLNGTVGSVPRAMEDSQSAAYFRNAYEAKFGEFPPQPYMDTAYDAVYLIALATQAAGSTERVAIRDHLRQVANPPGITVGPGEWARAVELLASGETVNYEGASGSVDFDENGDVPGTFAHWRIEDGAIVDLRVFVP
jgi:branched-chain amino acid transport system substrate-binding protein